MSVIMSQVFNFVDSSKTLKSKYVEKEILIFLHLKKIINYTGKCYNMAKNSFL